MSGTNGRPYTSDDPGIVEGAAGDGADFGPADQMLALVLASGSTVVDAARKLAIGEATVYRRLRDPAFRALISDRQCEIVSGAMAVYVGAMSDGMRAAVAKIRDLIDNGSTHAIQLNAAKSFVELSLRMREQLHIATAVDELKELVGYGQDQGLRPRTPDY